MITADQLTKAANDLRLALGLNPEQGEPILRHLQRLVERVNGAPASTPAIEGAELSAGECSDPEEIARSALPAKAGQKPPEGAIAEVMFCAAAWAEHCALEIAKILGVKLERATDRFNRVLGELGVYGDAANGVWQAKLERERADHLAEICAHAKLLAAVKNHHTARGHDKCWQTDCDLYRAAGIESGDPALPPRNASTHHPTTNR